MSYIVPIGLAIFCLLFSYIADRFNKQSCVWLIILALCFVSGFRGASVGIDTNGYLAIFNYIRRGLFQYAYGVEESFKYICYALLKIIPSERFLLILLAFVTNWCIVTRFWELRKYSSFPCMVLTYYASFYFATMNVARQFCAIALVFYGTRYLVQKRTFKFVVFVAIATLIHRSAIISLVLLVVNCLRWRELPKYQKRIYIFCAVFIPVITIYALRMLSRYSKYFSSLSMNVGFMVLMKICFFVATLILIFAMHPRFAYFRGGQVANVDDRFVMKLTCISYGMALILAGLGYFYSYVDRISWYFYLYEGVYFGMLIKGKKASNRIILGYVIAALLCYSFFQSMLHNAQGTMPYTFFWQ